MRGKSYTFFIASTPGKLRRSRGPNVLTRMPISGLDRRAVKRDGGGGLLLPSAVEGAVTIKALRHDQET